jgi:hypothetical protein
MARPNRGRASSGLLIAEEEVLTLLRRYGPMTDEEIAKRAKDNGIPQVPSGLRMRRAFLVGHGLVEWSGQKKPVSTTGSPSKVWRAIE